MSSTLDGVTNVVPLASLDGDYPGSLGTAALGFGMACVYRSPSNKRAAAQDIVDKFGNTKITDIEMISLLRDLLGESLIKDALRRFNSLVYHGLNLHKDNIVERPPLKDQHERVEGAMKLILDKSGIKVK